MQRRRTLEKKEEIGKEGRQQERAGRDRKRQLGVGVVHRHGKRLIVL